MQSNRIDLEALSVGDRVCYEDMANPRCEGVIADIHKQHWGTQYIVAWCGYRAGEISYSDCRQSGWKLA
jgi:hypothetical protein